MADNDKNWRRDRKCSFEGGLGPTVFYQETGVGAQRAKEVCWGAHDGFECPVRLDCLEEAVKENEIFGVWGGFGQRERVKIRDNWKRIGRVEDLPACPVRIRVSARAS